jgi:hypothetical protein
MVSKLKGLKLRNSPSRHASSCTQNLLLIIWSSVGGVRRRPQEVSSWLDRRTDSLVLLTFDWRRMKDRSTYFSSTGENAILLLSLGNIANSRCVARHVEIPLRGRTKGIPLVGPTSTCNMYCMTSSVDALEFSILSILDHKSIRSIFRIPNKFL